MRQLLNKDAEAKLEGLGSFIWFNDRPESSQTYLERVKDADGVLLNWHMPADVLISCSRLRIISFSGTDPRKFVDLSLATGKGIVVTNTPHYGDHAVAEHTLALMLGCAKRVAHFNSHMHQGLWEQGGFTFELSGKTLGLVGLGGVAAEVARLAQAFGMHVLCWTRSATPERAHSHGVHFVTLQKLFQESDVISLHLAHTLGAERIISRGLLESMKPGAIFINTARAELVDNAALAELLVERKLGAVGLDVYDDEPIKNDNAFLEIETAVLTPHVAFNTAEANCSILRISIDNLVAFFSGHPQNVVNSELVEGKMK